MEGGGTTKPRTMAGLREQMPETGNVLFTSPDVTEDGPAIRHIVFH